MATKRDLLKEAIADAKAVKETAIANAKAALEEAFTPYLKEKLSAKLAEMEVDEEVELEESDLSEVDKEKKAMEEEISEEVSLDELLAELEEEESTNETYMDEDAVYEAKGEEEEMSIEDMSEDDLKSFIEDVIKDMVEAGELEAGESMEGEGEAEVDMEAGAKEEELDEEFNIDELLAEVEAEKELEETNLNEVGYDQYLEPAEALLAVLATTGVVGAAALATKEVRDGLASALSKGKEATVSFINKLKGGKVGKEVSQTLKNIGSAAGSATRNEEQLEEMEEQLNELRAELNEVNLLNAKLLYTNKIFRNKSLTESQKVKVLTAFDKATTRKETQLIYETLVESLKTSVSKAPIKESLSSASKVLGGATSKPIIENDAFARMRELAFGGKK